MGCFKLTYQEEDTSLGQNWKVYASGVEKTAGGRKNRKDYYAGGSSMPGRTFSSNQYRYGFNGMEKDDEMGKGEGNSYTTEFRQYDPRLMRWLSIDPMETQRVGLTPYNFAQNCPIIRFDPSGALDHEYSVKKDGTVTKEEHVKGSTEDHLHTKENWDAGVKDKGYTVKDQDILPSLEKTRVITEGDYFDAELGWQYQDLKLSTYNSSYVTSKAQRVEALNLFFFFADNSPKAEWRMHITKKGKLGIGTYHSDDTSPRDDMFNLSPSRIAFMIHSHPNKRSKYREESGLGSDIGSAKYYDKYLIYMPYLRNLYKIDKNGKIKVDKR